MVLAALGLAAACGPQAPVMPKLKGFETVAPPTITGNDPRAALFLRKGCPTCHSIAAFGVKSASDMGPDLGNAAEDVRSRFGVPLEQFLPNPTGTMQMVLSQLITLRPDERDSVIHLLQRLQNNQPSH
jgi:hypothetical protein